MIIKNLHIAILIIIFFIFFIMIIISSYLQGTKIEDIKDIVTLKKSEQIYGTAINIWIDPSKIENLKDHNIKYLFVDVGDTGKDGRLKTPEYEIKKCLEMMNDFEKENNYEFILLPYSEVNTYDFNVDDSFKQNIIKDYLNLETLGFDGFHVDIEPIKFEQRESFLIFLNELKSVFPKNSIISVYSGSLTEKAFDFNNEWEWSEGFYKQVSENVDLIFVPGYDIHKNNKEEYKEYIRDQIKRLSIINLNSNLILGIPSHKKNPENIENCLSAYNEEIKKYPNSRFIGVSIFAEWTTSDNEWRVFDSFQM